MVSRILILSCYPESISEYLTGVGHEVIECLSVDVAERMIEKYNPDTVLFFEDVREVPPVTQGDVLKCLVPRARIIMLVQKTSHLVAYAAALGVRDFAFLPVDPAGILHRIENPASPAEAAEMMQKFEVRADIRQETQDQDTASDKKNLLGKLFTWQSSRKTSPKRKEEIISDDLFKMENLPEENIKSDTESTPTVKAVEGNLFIKNNEYLIDENVMQKNQQNVCYMPHHLIAVWSPSGWCKSYTAFNVAAIAAVKGFDVVLVNFDLLCPELDVWFEIKQTSLNAFNGCSNGLGIVTFGESFHPDLAQRLLKKYAWGINYLPAGNKLGNIGTPDLTLEQLELVLRSVYQRKNTDKPALTIVDAGSYYEFPSTFAALKQATIIIVPLDGSIQAAEIAKQHIEELNRLNINTRMVEICFAIPGIKRVPPVCCENITVTFNWSNYVRDSAARRPQCLRVEGRRIWEDVLMQLAIQAKE